MSEKIGLVLADVSIVSQSSIIDPNRKKTIKLAEETLVDPLPADSTLIPASLDSGVIVNKYSSEGISDKKEEIDEGAASTGMPADATIITDKAFFHSEPDVTFKTTKYLIRDNTFKVISQTSDFYYVEFTNDQAVVTRGWILKSETSVK
jgi:hypothetical protein